MIYNPNGRGLPTAAAQPQRTPLRYQDTDIGGRARRAYVAATDGFLPALRAALGAVPLRGFLLGRAESHEDRMQSPVAKVLMQQTDLANARVPEAHAVHLAIAVEEHHEALYAPVVMHRGDRELLAEDRDTEHREEIAETERLLAQLEGRCTARHYRDEAQARRQSAALDLEFARALETRARRLEREAGRAAPPTPAA